MGARLQAYYPPQQPLWTRLKLYWERVTYRLKDKDSDALVPEGLYTNTHNKLDSAVADVFKASYGDDHYDLQQALRKNASLFSAYKSAWFNEWLKGKATEEQQAVMDIYHRQLEAEGNMASRSSRSAKQWQGFEKTKAQYPNLEYLPSRSATKRHHHTQYYGTVLPINHAFWNTALPPNGWNCKCRVRATDTDTTNAKEPPKPIKGIVGNAGKEKTIFTGTHPFFKNTSTTGKERIEKEWRKAERKRVEVWAKVNLKDKVFKNGENEILINTKGIKEILNQNHDYYWEKNQLLFDIQEVIQQAVFDKYAPFSLDKKGASVFDGVYYFKITIQRQNNHLVIRKQNKKNGGRLILYDIVEIPTLKQEIKLG